MSESSVIDKEEYFTEIKRKNRALWLLRSSRKMLEAQGHIFSPPCPHFENEEEGMEHRVAELKLQSGFNLTLKEKVLLAKYKPKE